MKHLLGSPWEELASMLMQVDYGDEDFGASGSTLGTTGSRSAKLWANLDRERI